MNEIRAYRHYYVVEGVDKLNELSKLGYEFVSVAKGTEEWTDRFLVSKVCTKGQYKDDLESLWV